MSVYFPHTAEDVQAMLKACKANSIEDLYVDIPQSLFAKPLDIPAGKTQQEVEEYFNKVAEKNVVYNTILRGAGSYYHYVPPVVKSLASKGEFVTAYTPYQAEISQGMLKTFYEYQSLICRLLDMDVSNASVYNGSTAAAEAAIMCLERRKSKVIVANKIKPDTLKTLETYVDGKHGDVIIAPTDNGMLDIEKLEEILDDSVACVYLEQPNYYGNIEDAKLLGDLLQSKKIKYVMGINPIAAAILKTPGECNADIAVGEGQPLGLSLGFGGPYLGFMACTQKEVRRMPGRIVGKTVDAEGKDAYVLTLQAREQHIRREKAISNICSNQALCALTATLYLGAIGKEGLKEVAYECLNLAHYFANSLAEKGIAIAGDKEFFHEFVTSTPCKSRKILKALKEQRILGGHLLSNDEILWCVTEMATKDSLDYATSIISSVVEEVENVDI